MSIRNKQKGGSSLIAKVAFNFTDSIESSHCVEKFFRAYNIFSPSLSKDDTISLYGNGSITP